MATTTDDPRSISWMFDARQMLSSLGEEIDHQSAVQHTVKQQLKNAERDLADLRSETLAELACETDEHGKKKYANAEARDAAVVTALRIHPGAMRLRTEIQRLESDSFNATLNLESAARHRQDLHALLRWASDYLRYTAAEIGDNLR